MQHLSSCGDQHEYEWNGVIKRHNNINVQEHYDFYLFLYRDSMEPSCGRISLLLTAVGFLSVILTNPGMCESICWAIKGSVRNLFLEAFFIVLLEIIFTARQQ